MAVWKKVSCFITYGCLNRHFLKDHSESAVASERFVILSAQAVKLSEEKNKLDYCCPHFCRQNKSFFADLKVKSMCLQTEYEKDYYLNF